MAARSGWHALWRLLRKETQALDQPAPDPAAELRARLEQARETADDRDDFDAAEGQPVDEVGAPPAEARPAGGSLDERRRAVHEQAQEALDQMKRTDAED